MSQEIRRCIYQFSNDIMTPCQQLYHNYNFIYMCLENVHVRYTLIKPIAISICTLRFGEKNGIDTIWVVIVTPTYRPKLVRNRLVIEVFGGVCMLSRCIFFFRWVEGFLSCDWVRSLPFSHEIGLPISIFYKIWQGICRYPARNSIPRRKTIWNGRSWQTMHTIWKFEARSSTIYAKLSDKPFLPISVK